MIIDDKLHIQATSRDLFICSPIKPFHLHLNKCSGIFSIFERHCMNNSSKAVLK